MNVSTSHREVQDLVRQACIIELTNADFFKHDEHQCAWSCSQRLGQNPLPAVITGALAAWWLVQTLTQPQVRHAVFLACNIAAS